MGRIAPGTNLSAMVTIDLYTLDIFAGYLLLCGESLSKLDTKVREGSYGVTYFFLNLHGTNSGRGNTLFETQNTTWPV